MPDMPCLPFTLSQFSWFRGDHNLRQIVCFLQADRASSNWDIGYTDFLTPPVCAQAAKALEVIADVSGFSWGGYPQVGTNNPFKVRPRQLSTSHFRDPASTSGAVGFFFCIHRQWLLKNFV